MAWIPKLTANDSRRLGAYCQRLSFDQNTAILRYILSVDRPEKPGEFEPMTDEQLDALVARLPVDSS